MKNYHIGIVGAAGAVGTQIRKILPDSSINLKKVTMFGKPKRAGQTIEFGGDSVPFEEPRKKLLSDCDLILIAAGKEASRRIAPQAVEAGSVVVDNSSCWRLHPEVPLVVPEVNPQDLAWHEGIVASPNCSTIQMVMVLYPLHKRLGLKRVVVSTYQSVSGSGTDAVEELKLQTENITRGLEPQAGVYSHQIAFNTIPHIGSFGEDGYSDEEVKMIEETKKILDEDVQVSPTAVRLPIYRCHGESINIETKNLSDPAEVRELLSEAPGVVVEDDPKKNEYPLPLEVEGNDGVYVGRIRKDRSIDCGINLWVVADNLRKGAALNTVQIAEALLEKDLI